MDNVKAITLSRRATRCHRPAWTLDRGAKAHRVELVALADRLASMSSRLSHQARSAARRPLLGLVIWGRGFPAVRVSVDPVRPSHGVLAVNELRAHRASLLGHRRRAHAVVRRAELGDNPYNNTIVMFHQGCRRNITRTPTAPSTRSNMHVSPAAGQLSVVPW